MQVGVAEAKAQLWALLDAVEDGEEVVITCRGRPLGWVVKERPAAPAALGLGGAAAGVKSRSAAAAGFSRGVAARASGSGAVKPSPGSFYFDICLLISLFHNESGYIWCVDWLVAAEEAELWISRWVLLEFA